MKNRKDFITEEEYTRKIFSSSTSTSPEDDSPGDSEADSGAEFQMGVEYNASPTDEDEEEIDELTDEEPENQQIAPPQLHRIEEDELPDSAKVISSGQPAPWMDRENTSDTN